MEQKECVKCGDMLPIDLFHFRRSKRMNTCHSCDLKRKRELWQAQSEKYKAARRARWAADSGKSRTHQIEKYHANKDIERQKARKRYADKREVMQRRSREKHVKFRDKRNAYIAEYARSHQEYRVAKMARYRTRKTLAGGSYSAKEWRDLKDFFGNKCLSCGAIGVKLSADHVVPVALGGSSDISNIQPLCQPCNARKRTRIIDYRDARRFA